jgi:hypothetical protein
LHLIYSTFWGELPFWYYKKSLKSINKKYEICSIDIQLQL